MEDLARAEYPAMLAQLQPSQAVPIVADRIKRASKISLEIAEWLQERRRVEEQYSASLRKLTQFRVPNSQSELGVFSGPWTRILEACEGMAQTHMHLADRIDKDIESPLRAFAQRKDVLQMNTVSTNLATIARDLDDAKDKADKLTRKGGKANTQKVDAATSRLESSTQQWESQAPFIMEQLQAFDESRVNQLRDLLIQYQTHESEHAQQVQENAVTTLAMMLEISTEREVESFVQKHAGNKPRLLSRASSNIRQSPMIGSETPPMRPPSAAGSAAAPPSLAATPAPDDASEHNSVPSEPKPESKLRRFGTMFGGRRRQSIHGGYGQVTPQKTPSFPRLGSSGRHVSPRASSTNLREASRLSALAEAPNQPALPENLSKPTPNIPAHEGTNGAASNANLMDSPIAMHPPSSSLGNVNGAQGIELSDVAPPPGPPPSSQPQPSESMSPNKDAEGFTIPPSMNDPISEAQREAAGDEADQFFKLNIQTKPVHVEDPQEKQAAMSSVANSLKAGPAVRRTGTLRGRRDVRNTIYMASPNLSEGIPGDGGQFAAITGSPALSIPGSPPMVSRPGAVAALQSEASIAATSDTQSIRSGHSLGSFAHVKHPEMPEPGLNSSIIETVSAVFKDGAVVSAAIAGEVAFVNNPSPVGETKAYETIRINQFPNLERIGPNRIFVQNASPDQVDQYILDVSYLNKMTPGFSYRVFAEEAETPTLGRFTPLLVKPAWKPTGDKLGLLLQYCLNPASVWTAPVTLHNVVLVATYEGRATGAQTKPSGTHLKDKQLVYWRLGDVTLTPEPQKIVCRIVGADGTEPMPGNIEARWEYVARPETSVGSGISISRLIGAKGKGKQVAEDDPFADESLAAGDAAADPVWADVPLTRRLVSGKYEGRA